MADLIDQVFAKGIATVRELSSSGGGGLSRPPAETRARLYGLYKQATEGDVQGLMDRPVDDKDDINQKKWDAWKSCEGLGSAEAKKRYVGLLIETMRVYANGTSHAKEHLQQLDNMWQQIRDVDFSNSAPATGPGPGQGPGISVGSALASGGDSRRSSPILPSSYVGTNMRLSRVPSLTSPAFAPAVPYPMGQSGASPFREDELSRFKRDTQRALDMLNDHIVTLQAQVNELSRGQKSMARDLGETRAYAAALGPSMSRRMLPIVHRLWLVTWAVGKRLLVDGAAVFAVLYLVQWIRTGTRPRIKLPFSATLFLRLIRS